MKEKPLKLSMKVVVRDRNGRCLLLRRSARSKSNAGKWDFPGGKIDPGESFDEALLREVREETGLTIQIDGVAGSGSSESPERTIVYLFLEGRCDGGKVRLSAEHDKFRWLSLSELLLARGLSPQFRPFIENYCRARGYVVPSDKHGKKKLPVASAASLEKWVRRYRKVLPLYKRYAVELERVLKDQVRHICPTALVQARAKTIPSYAEKILRKNKYTDPLKEITDLCGARVVTHIKSEEDEVCEFIKKNFVIDGKNSSDTLSRLGATEFGYRSVHFIVQFKRKKYPGLPGKLYSLKAEIQVRTIAQHAWSDIGHDRIYKSGFKVPALWEREAARLAARLEGVDDGFSHLVEGVEAYRCNFGAYLTPEQIAREMEIVETVLKHDSDNGLLVHRLARLAISADNWRKAVQIVKTFQRRCPAQITSELLCCLGSALCHLHKDSPNSREYREGRTYLRQATEMDPRNVEARVRLAETAVRAEEQMELYRQAFDVSPSDPAALGGYVLHRISIDRNTSFVPLLRPSLEAAIAKCRLQVSVEVNIPWALYRIAAFQLLLGPEHEWGCLENLCQAIKRTEAGFHVDKALEAAETLARVEPTRRDVKCVRRLLLVARQARFPKEAFAKTLSAMATRGRQPIRSPVVIVAGGCDPAHEAEMMAYRGLLRMAFADFSGTVISGGTREGISGLIGELGKASNGRIHTIGYLPATLPADGTAHIDERYGEPPRNTEGEKVFSALEPLQNWIDLLTSGIQPADVRVLGINGGRIAGFEYRLGWALGAKVGVVRDSGREASKIEGDVKAEEFAGMLILPKDASTLRAFLHVGGDHVLPFTPYQREGLARLAHAKFLEENRYKNPDRAMRSWDDLDQDLRKSNLDQIAYMVQTLRAAGFVVKPSTRSPRPPKLTPGEIELMARVEHGRWNVERVSSGWHYDKERNPDKKLSPYLVAWEQLTDDVKEYDRTAVRRFPQFLAEAGFQIVRHPK